MSVQFFLISVFIESEPLKDLIWHKFLFCWNNLKFEPYVSVLSSGKSTVRLFLLSHFNFPLKLYEGYVYDSYRCGMWYL